MNTKSWLVVVCMLAAFTSLESHAAPEVCVESVKYSWQQDRDDLEALYQPAAYQCKELADLDKRADSAIIYADTAGALSICTGQIEATAVLAAARGVLGIIKITIRNLPCQDGSAKTKSAAVEAACSVFARAGIPCAGAN